MYNYKFNSKIYVYKENNIKRKMYFLNNLVFIKYEYCK